MFSSSSKISVRTWGSLEQKKQYQTDQYKIQTADRVENAAYVQNADWEFILCFRLLRDNMSSYNLPSVTQLIFRDHLSS